MQEGRFQRIDAVFAQALELPAADRGAFLAAACGDDHELRREVEELLTADRRASGFLATSPEPALLAPGTRVGPYQLEGLLGRGGMGSVYLARRADLDRPVALKLVDAPYRHPELVPRFHAERQILARLEHPSIARLYDAGETADGVPYLVLEYVDGEPLDRYCDRLELGLEERVGLFRKLLDAVAHAHQSLLVHRDIKPSNVLVTSDGQVRLLDFGIAQRLDPHRRAASATTSRMMTPAYASPEQVRGEPLTTATDIFSLGVVLYELLTGRRPYQVKSELPHELEAAILKQEPERPSLATAPWRRQLAGDLDTIVLTALDKEPAKRYRSVLELQADLERWSDHRPISARPPSRAYRLTKFVRRHRAGVAAGVLGAALGLGLVVSLFQERDRAARERDRARDALAFVVDVFATKRPYDQGSQEISAREILAAAARRAEAELGADPDLQAALFRSVGQATAGIGRYAEAAPLLARSLEHHARAQPDSAEHAASLEAIGWNEFLLGQRGEAIAHLEKAVALRRRLAPGSLDLALALNLLGNVETERVRTTDVATLERIAAYFNEALELNRRLEGPNSSGVIASLGGLVKIAAARGELPQAEQLARQVVAASLTAFGPEHPETVSSQRSLAYTLVDQAKFSEAEVLFRDSLATLERILPADHPEIDTGITDVGLVLSRQAKFVEAEPFLRRAYDSSLLQRGEEHPDTIISLGNLAMVVQGQGRLAEAIPLREREVALGRRVHGADSVLVAQTLGSLARALADSGQVERALPIAHESLAIQAKVLEPGHPSLAWPHRSLGMVLSAAGQWKEAAEHLKVSLEILRRTQAPDFFQTARVEVLLGSSLTHLGQYEEAEQLITHGREVLESHFPPEHERVVEARAKWAELERARGTVRSS
jgi:eukaryotic-like serine/threonine-protein kinase